MSEARVFLVAFAVGCGGSSSSLDAGSHDFAIGGNVDNGMSSDFAQSQSDGDGSSQTSDGGASTTMVNPAPGSKFFIGANFWDLDYEGTDDYFQSGVVWQTTADPWVPALLTDLAPYHVLRFKDWNQIDNDPQQDDWSKRTQKTATQTDPAVYDVQIAYEWQIDLCNRTKKDYWLNVSTQSSSTYWTQVAQLVHDSLDPSLRVYIEWSNEVWNATYPQYNSAQTAGRKLKLAGADSGMSYQVYASVRMFEAFEAVFGKGSPRLVKVIAGQSADTAECTNQVIAFSDKTINPNGTTADVYAVAPYFSGTSINALSSSIKTTVSWTQSDLQCAKSANLPLVAYESGSDSFSGDCASLQEDPGMHDLYMAYFDQQSGAGMVGPFMQYTHSGTCWGLKAKTTDSNDNSPKYKGVTDWLAAHP